MKSAGRPAGGAKRPGRRIVTFSLDDATDELITKLADTIAGSSGEGNRSELVRNAVRSYFKEGRIQRDLEFQATIDALTAERDTLRRANRLHDTAQQRIGDIATRQQALIDPERTRPSESGRANSTPTPRTLRLAEPVTPRCTPEAAERFVRQNPRRAWEQVLHATDGRPDAERRAVWIDALVGHLHGLDAVRAFVERVLRDSQDPPTPAQEAPT